MGAAGVSGIAAASAILGVARVALAVNLQPHPEVHGVDLTTADVRSDAGAWELAAGWDTLDGARREPGAYELRLHVAGGKDGATVQVPPCAGRGRVLLDGQEIPAPVGPALGLDEVTLVGHCLGGMFAAEVAATLAILVVGAGWWRGWGRAVTN